MKYRLFKVSVGVALSLCMTVMFGSWMFSFWIPHGFEVGTHRRYGIWCERGTVQFRLQTQSVMQIKRSGQSVVEIGFDGAKLPSPPLVTEVGFDGKNGRRPFNRRLPLVLSPWRPFQHAEIVVGGMLTRGGTPAYFGYQIQAFGVAHWVLTIPPALALGWFLRREILAHRIAPGCCPACGYDLRATPNRCPECGHLSFLNPRIGKSLISS